MTGDPKTWDDLTDFEQTAVKVSIRREVALSEGRTPEGGRAHFALAMRGDEIRQEMEPLQLVRCWSRLWPDEATGPYRLELTFTDHECTGVDITALTDASPKITTTLFRQLNLGEETRRARAHLWGAHP